MRFLLYPALWLCAVTVVSLAGGFVPYPFEPNQTTAFISGIALLGCIPSAICGIKAQRYVWSEHNLRRAEKLGMKAMKDEAKAARQRAEEQELRTAKARRGEFDDEDATPPRVYSNGNGAGYGRQDYATG